MQSQSKELNQLLMQQNQSLMSLQKESFMMDTPPRKLMNESQSESGLSPLKQFIFE